MTRISRLLPRALCTALFTLAMGTSHAAPSTPSSSWPGLYQGRIGAQPVVVALYLDESQRLVGRYFYDKHGRDIPLWGPDAQPPTDPGLTLSECESAYSNPFEPCDPPAAHWQLTRPGPSMSGQWVSLPGPGRTGRPNATIELRRLGPYAPSANAFQDRYEQLRMRGVREVMRPGGQLGSVRWNTLVDPRTQVSTPQFTAGPAAPALARINQALKKHWRQRVSEFLTAVDHADAVQVVFANQRWLSITHQYGFYYAGAAHPSGGFATTTWDMATGRDIQLARLFRIGSPQKGPLELQRQDVLAALTLRAFAAQRAELSPAQRADSCASQVLERYECAAGRCASAELSAGRQPGDWLMWPTPAGLAVSPDIYPESNRNCRGEHVVIPWTQARAALVKPQPLP